MALGLWALTIVAPFTFFPTVLAANLSTVLAGHANLTTFRGLVKSYTNIFANLPKQVTIAAPNDYAFSKYGNLGTSSLAQAILNYHVVNQSIPTSSIVKGHSVWAPTLLTDARFANVTRGQRLMLNKQPDDHIIFTSGFATRGTVVVADLGFDNGLVQVVDSVMRMPDTLDATARNAYADLTAFVGALHASGLMSELAQERDVTVFAPRNAAFQQLGGVLQAMDKAALKRVLQYHVVPGRVVQSWELQNASSLATAARAGPGPGPVPVPVVPAHVTITRDANSVYVNSAQVVQTDILVANGVVHLLDDVLNPDRPDARPDPAATAPSPAFSLVGATATGAAVPTPFASDLPCTASCAAQPTNSAGGGGGTASRNVAAARCTGLAGAGVGLGLALGALVAGL